eukprot:1137439-Pelagomonas_calceolata.AAC.9
MLEQLLERPSALSGRLFKILLSVSTHQRVLQALQRVLQVQQTAAVDARGLDWAAHAAAAVASAPAAAAAGPGRSSLPAAAA